MTSRPRRLASFVPALLTGAAIACAADGGSPVAPGTPAAPVVAPACVSPAPLDGTYDPRAPGYLVVLPRGVEAGEIGARLAAMYGVSILTVYEAVDELYVDGTPAQIARLRCDPNVLDVGFNGVVHANN